MDVRSLSSDIVKYREKLSPQRIEKINHSSTEEERLLSIGSELVLNYALRQINPNITIVEYEYDNLGKPILKNSNNIHFSISHSNYYVAVAISDSVVGVDIQYRRKGNPLIAKRYFHADEYLQIINNNDWQTSFYQMWVLKESYLKATGQGLMFGMNSFKINLDDLDETSSRLGYYFALPVVKENHQLGICIKGQMQEIEVIKLESYMV